MNAQCESVDLNEENNKLLLKLPYNYDFIWFNDGSSNKEIFLPRKFLKISQQILDMEVRPDDIWVITYPKTGTTWAQEMVWCIENDLDFKKAETVLIERFPFLEYEMLVPDGIQDQYCESIKQVINMTSPRFIKTHLPWTLLPRQIQDGTVKPKIIYVTRNPADVCTSFFNHYQILQNFQGSLDDFCELFVNNKVLYGSYYYHLKSYLKNKHNTNILIIKFEEMKIQLANIIAKVAEFLNKTLSDNQIKQLCDHLSFDKMKNNPAVNFEQIITEVRKEVPIDGRVSNGSFMNRGQVGYSKNILSDKYRIIIEEQRENFEKLTEYKFE